MATKDRTSLKNDFANGKYATGEKFADLIDSMKVVQLPVVDPQALGTSLSFIDSISQDEDGKITATKKRISPTVGSFQFVANDTTAEAAFTAVGAKYSGAISGVLPSADTLGVILLMNDDDTTPTKTMMITTEEVTPATNPATYQFVYVGDLQSALPSGVLTAADIVNGFAGGVDKVLSAEAGKELSWRKNVMLDILDVDASTLTNIPYGVVDVGVTPGITLPANNSEDYWVLNHCCCRLTSGVPRFRMKISDAQGNTVIGINESISAYTGRKSFSYGGLYVYVDCNWLKSRLLSSVENVDARINPTKLTQTTVSVSLKRNYEIKSGNDLKRCNTAPATAAKEVAYPNFIIPTQSTTTGKYGGNVGKIIMTYANTAASGVTLNIGGTGAYPLFYNGAAVTDENTWAIGEVVDVYFDGTNYYANSVVPVSGGGGVSDDFVGTDGTSAGVHGLVPAPTAAQKDYVLSANGGFVRNDGYLYNREYSVETNSNRTKTFTIEKGKKIVIKVSKVTGTSSSYNAAWIKEGGNVAIYSGYPLGYMSDVLTVPEDATGVIIFMTPAASGNKNKVEIFDASRTEYLPEKLDDNVDGIAWLNNRQIIYKEISLTENNSLTTVLSGNECRLKNLSGGDIYAFIDGDCILNNDGSVDFWDTSSGSSATSFVLGLQMRQQKLFKIYNGTDNKTLSRITVAANSVKTAGTLKITIFAMVPSNNYTHYPLYGKRIMCFGDSQTEFKSGIDRKRWSDHFAELSQAVVYNAAIGGTRYAQRYTPTLTPSGLQEAIAAFEISSLVYAWCNNDYSYQDAVVASGKLGANQASCASALAVLKAHPIGEIDLVIIYGGNNDYNGTAIVGSQEWNNYNMGTTTGAINQIVKSLYETKRTIQLYMTGILPAKYAGGFSDDYTPSDAPLDSNNNPMSRSAFNDVIHNMAKLNHIPFLDWYWDCGWNRYNWDEYHYIVGNTHSFGGFQYIADKVYKFLCSK